MSAILKLEKLTRFFDGVRAVDNVSFTIEQGKITSLIGPNGAGKTTLFNILSGLIKPDSGEVVFNGRRLNNGVSPWERAKLGIGRLFQDVRVFDKLTVIENVLLARPNQLGENPLGSIFFRARTGKCELANLAEAERWLDFVGLPDKKDAPAESLSYGQQKLLAIARLLAGGFSLLLLDEPTAGVHPKMVHVILDVVRKLVKEGKTVVVIEHNMNVVTELSHWVFFMDEGKLVSFGLPHEVLGDPMVREAYLGVQ